MGNNASELIKAKKVMQNIVSGHIYDMLAKVCDDLLADAVVSKEFQGFTGNTQTSYACGLYIDGALKYYINQKMWSKSPVRKKVPKGVRVFLNKPYEGNPRAVTGRVDVDDLYGKDSSFDFLKSYKGFPDKSFGIVMATGTEYSEYIESVHNLNVLTDTFQRAKQILSKNLKPIP